MPTSEANDITIRSAFALAEIIKTTKPKAVVIPYWVLTVGLTESIPYLVSPDEDEWGETTVSSKPGWIHAYMIGHNTPFGREQLGVAKFEDTAEFKLWAFYGWQQGNAEKNSEHIFVKHLVDVADAISEATKFQQEDTPNGVPEVKGHYHWQIDEMGTYNFSKTRVHVAQGTLRVKFNRLINPISIT